MLAPPVKSGATICGAKLQVPVPAPSRSESSVLTEPTPAVRVMRGKNAARAAPMLAFAERSWCSAARMSGRRSRTSDERPARTGRGALTAERPSGSSSGLDGRAHQDRERVLVDGEERRVAGDVRAGGLHLALDLAELEVRRDAQVAALLDQGERGLLRLEGSLREPEAVGVRRDRQVALGHGRDEGHLRRAPRLLRGEVLLESGPARGCGRGRRGRAPSPEIPSAAVYCSVVKALSSLDSPECAASRRSRGCRRRERAPARWMR